jgi:steroid delta-isomerase-like uncharacterized protein
MNDAFARTLVRRWYREMLGQGRLDLANELFTADYVGHDVIAPPGGWRRGPEGARAPVAAWRTGMPDVQFSIDELLGEADRIALRWSGWGTSRGCFLGLPPTGQSFRISGISFARIAGERIAESWISFDTLDLLRQIGALPAPEPPGL